MTSTLNKPSDEEAVLDQKDCQHEGRSLDWHDYLQIILNEYRDKPDDFVISLGHWSEPRPTMIPEVALPDFQAFLRMTVGELKALETDRAE